MTLAESAVEVEVNAGKKGHILKKSSRGRRRDLGPQIKVEERLIFNSGDF